MNLREYNNWERTKTYLLIFVPLGFILLFIHPYVSLLIYLILFLRFVYIYLCDLVFKRLVEKSKLEDDLFLEKIGSDLLKGAKKYAQEQEKLSDK